MERCILRLLKFNLNVPDPVVFLERFLLVCPCDLNHLVSITISQIIQVIILCERIYTIGPDKQNKFSKKLGSFSYPSVQTCVLGAQKNRLNERVLLSTHNIWPK